MSPLKSYGCAKCGKQAPTKLRADGKFEERFQWLRRHYKKNHPVLFKRSIRKGVATRKS